MSGLLLARSISPACYPAIIQPYFHWKTILLPAWVAEYVVVHELAHLHEPHHTPEFWLRVERAMPDYEHRKAWLAEHGMGVEGL